MTTFPLACQLPDLRFTMRAARPTDADSLIETCWPGRPFNAVFSLLQRAARAALESQGQALVLVDPSAGTACGYGQVMLWPTTAEISDLVVAERWRGQGAGTALVQRLVHVAAELGTSSVEIGAALTNTGALALYERLGFEDSHTLRVHLDGILQTVRYLRLSLEGLRV